MRPDAPKSPWLVKRVARSRRAGALFAAAPPAGVSPLAADPAPAGAPAVAAGCVASGFRFVAVGPPTRINWWIGS